MQWLYLKSEICSIQFISMFFSLLLQQHIISYYHSPVGLYDTSGQNYSSMILRILAILGSQNIRDGLRKCMYSETECVMALQGHPRSLLAPIESACATFY